MGERLVEIRELKTHFATEEGLVPALDGVTFHIDQGETLGVVGESGCGKSVTANSIMQLLPMPPAFYKGGEILFQGEDIVKKSEKEMQKIRGSQISMVFQDPMTSLNPTMRVGQQIAEGLRKHQGLSKEEANKKALDILHLVSVPEPEKRMRQYPHEFSGGMRQRVMIAIAMVSRPMLLIADEPTTALDVTVQAQILELMKELKEKLDTSIILITHDLGVVADMADVVEIMYAGQIMEEGLGDEIFKNPMHPYTQQLLASVPRLNMDRKEPLHAIAGTPPDLYIPPKGCPFFERCNAAMKICDMHMPPEVRHSETHYSRCWLYHSMAENRRQS